MLARSKSAQVVSVPAPVGGLNARDGIANMSPNDAVVMENWFPTPSSVDLRGGSEDWATGITGDVNTLAVYNGNTGSKLFAAAGANIYDATTMGAVGAAVVTGLTSDKWQTCQMGNVGGRFLLMFNGSDSARYYDGTSWITVTLGGGATQISGVNPNVIINCNIYKRRLFLVEKDTANVWYLPINSIYGAATKFDLSPNLRLGGTIVAMATWTADNTSGVKEYAVFISSAGEVIIYEGADPSSATDWAIAGSCYIGRPSGYRCTEKVGTDLVILCADGAFPLSKALTSDSAQENESITSKIQKLVSDDITTYGNNFGWQAKLYPDGNKLIVNVPKLEGTLSYQYVMNIITGAWCKFTGWNAFCFAVMGQSAFYGADGKVVKCDTGNSDNNVGIQAVCISAFNYFGGSNEKLFTAIRPIITSNGAITPSVAINTDFDLTSPSNVAAFSNVNFTPWYSPWYSPWSSSNQTRKDWQSVNGYGFTGAVAMAVNSKNADISWQSTDVVFKVGQTF
jgi:hypothetical protein